MKHSRRGLAETCVDLAISVQLGSSVATVITDYSLDGRVSGRAKPYSNPSMNASATQRRKGPSCTSPTVCVYERDLFYDEALFAHAV